MTLLVSIVIVNNFMEIVMRLLLVFVLCSLGANLMAQDLKLMTLNLHGFHPTGEAPRFFEYKDGSVEETSSHILV